MATLASLAPMVALGAIATSALALAALHVASPEYAPSWRMISEYANGKHGWLLTAVFLTWALGSLALLVALWPLASGGLAKAGLVLLALAALGQAMGGPFDINHKLHGPAAMIGIPALAAACVVLQIAMARVPGLAVPPTWVAHLTWVSFALMIATFFLFFAALKGAGIDPTAQSGPLAELPAGVTGYLGWANRLIFAGSYLWVGWMALGALRATG